MPKVTLKGEVQAGIEFVLKASKHMFVGLNYWPYENPMNVMTCDIISAWNLIGEQNFLWYFLKWYVIRTWVGYDFETRRNCIT